MQPRHQQNPLIALSLFALCAVATPATAATVAYYTANGVGLLGNPQSWNSTDNTGQSVAFELNINFTPDVDDPAVPIVLWEAGATGSGAALVLNGGQLHFFAGNDNTDVVTGNHGLSATQNGVQIVSVFEREAGTGGTNATDEKLTIYVDGLSIASGDFATANIWAGSDAAGLGMSSGNTRYVGTSLFAEADVISYPNEDISLSVYRLASSGGNADNTLPNILVPEPSSLVLIGISSLLVMRRRR